MTRLPTTLQPPTAPHSVVLAELAIAAGIAGHSITLYHDGYPAPLLCGLWRHFSHIVGHEQVYQVSGQADIRKLAGMSSKPRLVLVHQPRLVNPAAWAIQMAAPAVERASCPALFCPFAPSTPEGDPGSSLVLRASPSECVLIQQWLLTGSLGCLGVADVDRDGNTVVSELEPVLSAALTSTGIASAGFRDREVLLGLLAGACLLRRESQGDASGASLTMNLQDYELVRSLLQSPILVSPDEHFDPLAAAMVSRANVYLSVKCGAAQEGRSPFPAGPNDIQGERPPRELITRREIADIGHIHSGIVRRLIAFLQHQADGYERFRRMGLVRRPPEREAWRGAEVDTLIPCLRPWSSKQVRTHFDELRRSGMITAEREDANGPWRYALPEELRHRGGSYHWLPTAAELIGHHPPV